MSAVPFNVIADFRKRASQQIQKLNPDFHPYRFKIKHEYPIRLDEKVVYYAHSRYFDVILAESWREALCGNFQDLSFESLLNRVWESDTLKKESMSFRHDLDVTFSEFKDLVKEQFLYISDGKESFLFSLYRILDDGLPTGGFFHFLVGHFEEYSSIHPQSNDKTEYWPNDLLRILSLVALDPDEEEVTEEKANGNYTFTRKRVCKYFSRIDEQNRPNQFLGAFYYEDRSKLSFVNTFHRC
jgi:hypothetical protein